mgnify:CR=1 FL=1
MYESPITAIVNDICSDLQKKEDKHTMECVRNVGIDVNKKELLKALSYDRNQYEKGYKDGYNDGLNQISKDLRKVVEILFSNKYPEYKEDELIELLKPYIRESD